MNNIIYKYPFFLNIPILRQLCITLSSFIYSFLFLCRNRDSVAVFDILSRSNVMGARLACKILRKKCIGIVTDVPGKRSEAIVRTLPKYQQYILRGIEKKEKRDIHKYDAYLFLTEAMNQLINLNDKPYIVLEGHADINMLEVDNMLDHKYERKTVLYSGGLYKESGIEMLVKAFLSLDVDDWELHIYGKGNYTKQLETLAAENKRICYFGVVENARVVEAQMKAHLLVNPRLTDAEYTKYSFPSKMLEYMASGTPVLSTRLPGMPKEYYEYIYTINDESMDGFQEGLRNVLSQNEDALHEKGNEARHYILEKKNNITQAIKLLNLIQEICPDQK